MYFKIVLNFLMIIILVLLQFSFVSAMPIFFGGANFLLIAIIFAMALFGENLSWWWALGFGGFYDLLSFTPFGVFLVSYVFVFFVINFLQKNFFTNRSLYSFFALIIFASVTYKFVLYGVVSLLDIWVQEGELNFFYKDFWKNETLSLFLNVSLVFVVYIIVNFVSKRLKPTFLIKRQNV